LNKVLPVFCPQQRAKCLDAFGNSEEVVTAVGEHGVNHVMAVALIAEIDAEAVVEEGEEVRFMFI
jgi:hypothetical protein